MSDRVILVTGFEPFAGYPRNPSAEAVLLIANWMKIPLVAKVLPVEYTAAARQLDALIDELNPCAWVGFGLHQKASAITLERTAVNLDDASIADNAGDLRQAIPIQADGEKSYRSTLPLAVIEADLIAQQIPVNVSDNAGRFVCNHVFYTAILKLTNHAPKTPAGFIHLPWPCDWASGGPSIHSITFATITKAVQMCVGRVHTESCEVLSTIT